MWVIASGLCEARGVRKNKPVVCPQAWLSQETITMYRLYAPGLADLQALYLCTADQPRYAMYTALAFHYVHDLLIKSQVTLN